MTEQNVGIESSWNTRAVVDQRFDSVSSMYNDMYARWENTRLLHPREVSVEAGSDRELVFGLDGDAYQPTHWGFNRLCKILRAPVGFLRRLPPGLTAEVLRCCLYDGYYYDHRYYHRYGLNGPYPYPDYYPYRRRFHGGDIGYIVDKRNRTLRDFLDPWEAALYQDTYSNREPDRIPIPTQRKDARAPEISVPDIAVVKVVKEIVNEGIGDSEWKTPSELNWMNISGGKVKVPQQQHYDSDSLFSSDRYIFLFLVDNKNEVEIDGEIYLRGFYVWNSEAGAIRIGISFFYLRARCTNRQLWEVENEFEMELNFNMRIVGSFREHFISALHAFTSEEPKKFISLIRRAQMCIVATNDEERISFLSENDLGHRARKIINQLNIEEDKLPESIFDFVQGTTAYAKSISRQDTRLKMEHKGRKLIQLVGDKQAE